MTIEAIVRYITKDPEKALRLLEYSYTNLFDYIVKSMTDGGVNVTVAREIALRIYLNELNGGE